MWGMAQAGTKARRHEVNCVWRKWHRVCHGSVVGKCHSFIDLRLGERAAWHEPQKVRRFVPFCAAPFVKGAQTEIWTRAWNGTGAAGCASWASNTHAESGVFNRQSQIANRKSAIKKPAPGG